MSEFASEQVKRIDTKKILIIIFSVVGLAAIITAVILILHNSGIIGGDG
ncbi:MAG: hypothetical protein ACFFA4_12515 [Promethearchaeota archaeon]